MFTVHGFAVSPGVAQGKAFFYVTDNHDDKEMSALKHAPVRTVQHERIRSAMNDVHHSLETDARHISSVLGGRSGDIFRAQSAMMKDSSVMGELEGYLARGLINAEEAVRAVFTIIANRFRAVKSDMMHSRGDDMDDLSRRLLLSLKGIHAHHLENIPPGSVLVARRLFPSDTVYLSRSTTVAVLAEFGGPAAHAALLARELGIPCVGGIAHLLQIIHPGDDVIVDGTLGLAMINPDRHTTVDYASAIEKGEKTRLRPTRIERHRTTTRDGCEVSVMANARSREDVSLAVQSGADGIGLFRTEPFFMASKHLPSEQEFSSFLTHSLEPAGNLRVNIRLLDLGADKNPVYLPLPSESDPFLGLRGVRVLLRYPEFLESQIRVLLDCSRRFNIGILIPMVTVVSDVVRVVDVFRKIAKSMGIRSLPPIGAMIETPAAALSVRSLVPHVDFFSIGSNDLTQYTMAAGRENQSVAEYFMDDHASVLRLINIAITDAKSTPVSLCGELAGKIKAVPELMKIGLRSLSVAPSLLMDARLAVQESLGVIPATARVAESSHTYLPYAQRSLMVYRPSEEEVSRNHG